MKKYDMALVVFAALYKCSMQRARYNAERGHGEFVNIMKNKKERLTELYNQAEKTRKSFYWES